MMLCYMCLLMRGVVCLKGLCFMSFGDGGFVVSARAFIEFMIMFIYSNGIVASGSFLMFVMVVIKFKLIVMMLMMS